tara:strand:- start:330 stop:557 length:228 start_codon:yes stop_codon:yes gene_type:complete
MRVPIKASGEAIDVIEMAEMSEEEYLDYLQSELLYTDSNWNVRSNLGGGFPLTVNRRQLQLLIEYLQKHEARFND